MLVLMMPAMLHVKVSQLAALSPSCKPYTHNSTRLRVCPQSAATARVDKGRAVGFEVVLDQYYAADAVIGFAVERVCHHREHTPLGAVLT